MSRFHDKQTGRVSTHDTTPAHTHLNWMGGHSWKPGNPLLLLRMAAASCFFGEPQYYHVDGEDKRPATRPPSRFLSDADRKRLRETLDAQDPGTWRGKSPTELMEGAIDEALSYDPETTLKLAVALRHEDNIRTTPQVILVRAAHHPKVRGTGLIRQYGGQIMHRLDEPTVALAYQLWRYPGKPVPNALKKAISDRLAKATAYELMKYKLEGKGVKLVDAINLTHPKSEEISKFMRGEIKNTGETWEALISKEGSSKEAWEKAIDVMGHMALLRNLRNFLDKKVDPKLFMDKLVETAEKGRQLPFRYVSAYNAVAAGAPPQVLDGIERALKVSLHEQPQFKGRVMSLCDNSGSATGTTTSSLGTMRVSTIANLTGVLTGMMADEGYVGVFGDRLKVQGIRKGSSVFDQLKAVEALGATVGGGTENGIWLFWDKAIREKEHWDHVFVYSDMQAGHGGLYGLNPSSYDAYRWGGGPNIDVPKLIATYKKHVNPNVQVYLVQVAGYQDTIVPEFYDGTYILGGWGDGILRFAAAMSDIRQSSK